MEGFLRLKGARDLSRRELAVLREVANWRDTVAAQLDRATFRVMGNEVLFELARRAPKSVSELSAIKGMPKGMIERGGRRHRRGDPTRSRSARGRAAEVSAAVSAGTRIATSTRRSRASKRCATRRPRDWSSIPECSARASGWRTSRAAAPRLSRILRRFPISAAGRSRRWEKDSFAPSVRRLEHEALSDSRGHRAVSEVRRMVSRFVQRIAADSTNSR